MREILFRGKHVEDGKWFFGCLVHRTQFYGIPDDDYFILYDGEFHCDFYGSVEVDFKTLGQYTGLTDKNGIKIFEGDILEFPDRLVEVFWHAHLGCWDCNFLKYTNKEKDRVDMSPCNWEYNSEVIGNIYDNPELLKGGE